MGQHVGANSGRLLGLPRDDDTIDDCEHWARGPWARGPVCTSARLPTTVGELPKTLFARSMEPFKMDRIDRAVLHHSS